MLREDDSDIDAQLGHVVDLPTKATKAARSKAKVAELSVELAGELKRNAVTAAAPKPFDIVAAIAQHHAREPGAAQLLDVEPDAYHELPGLSSSIAKVVIDQSPLHAFAQHRMFGGRGREATKLMDRGNVVHSLVLGRGKKFEVLDFDNYKTHKAQDARDAARAAGLIPILAHDLEAAEQIAAAILRQLPEHGITLVGQSEVAIEWWEQAGDEQFIRCRGMFDHLLLSAGVIIDLKITGDASPGAIERGAENMGYALQQAAYRRALTALRPELAGRIDFLFVFAEADYPHAINVVRGDGVFREIGDRRWQRAVHTWGRCLATNTWPSYGGGINQLSPPAWALSREGYDT